MGTVLLEDRNSRAFLETKYFELTWDAVQHATGWFKLFA